ncbi:hypothetical protein SNEBB_004579 [Seison nebaliae]|nr:hypothetical protein SNEBB_004579 [Seison nebaliae]
MNQSINNFSFKIYETLFNEDDNIIFSPVSLATAMSLATVGARGKCFDELQKALNLPGDIKTIGDEFQKLMKSLNSLKEVTMVNKMLVHDKMKIESSYKEIAKEQFQAEARNVDFGGDKKQIVDEVNNWVSKNTNQMIKQLLSQSDINPLTKFILLNAIHFKGIWKSQFKKDRTKPFDFHKANGKIVKMQAMTEFLTKFDFLHNCKELDAKVLKMPYLGDRLSFVVVLPNDKNNGFRKILGKFNSEVFCQVLNRMPHLKVNVVIPKFKIETSESMVNNFKKLGISRCFSEKSDFTGIVKDEELFISEIFHKAVIDVNEEGTEAAAVTLIRLRGGANVVEEPIEIICDRPFHYFIYDEELKTILFAGFFADPLAVVN